jgi:hypothetical protein
MPEIVEVRSEVSPASRKDIRAFEGYGLFPKIYFLAHPKCKTRETGLIVSSHVSIDPVAVIRWRPPGDCIAERVISNRIPNFFVQLQGEGISAYL